jgi:DNA-binding NarL/FixJ family response regulator
VVLETVVALHATDPMTRLGAASILGADRRLKMVTDAEIAAAEVLVVVEEFLTAIECGMAAVLRRSGTSAEELVQTILAVAKGAAYLPPRLQGNLLGQLHNLQRDVLEPHGLTLSGMSERERDVLRLLADGHDTEEIATMLAYSGSTVKNVLHGLMSRWGLNTRAHAVAFAVRAGAI